MANLLQVSSACGRAMESVDRTRMNAVLYPVLQRMLADGSLTREGADNAIASSVEGFSFPTNLDRDPPLGGLAPETQKAIFHRALDAKWEPAAFLEALEKQARKKLT